MFKCNNKQSDNPNTRGEKPTNQKNNFEKRPPNNPNLDVTAKVVCHIGPQEQTRPQTTTRGAGSTHRRGPVLARAHVPRAAAEPSGAAGQGLARPPPRPPARRQRWVTRSFVIKNQLKKLHYQLQLVIGITQSIRVIGNVVDSNTQPRKNNYIYFL